MKESRWRSMSIMDLHKRKSMTSGGGCQESPSASTVIGQFELIKSTQSLVERLHLNAEDITIQPVHPSIIGEDTWFQITYTSSGTTRYFSCQNTKERDDWILSLKKTLMLNEDHRRTDNTLKLGVLEVKGLSDKNRYFVEIHLDDKLYARTSSKKMNGMCFWGEHFEFKDLPSNTEKIQLLIHKDKGNHHRGSGKKPKKPVGRVKISISSVQSRYVQEKWHNVEKASRRDSPSLRLKCQFQSVDILPLREYEDFSYFLKDEYKNLVKLLEPVISVKVKEELSYSLMSVFHSENIAEDVLAEIVVDEISNVENEHLTFRGNSIATKAMEAYIKLVGQRYLKNTLQNVIKDIIDGEQDLEIDPIKVSNVDLLNIHRTQLRTRVKQVWHRISNSYSFFPIQLQRCFFKIRQYLTAVGKPEMGDNLISSCIFLRYLCPAILSPSLFSLTDEYPGDRANRNLTLIAKTLQTLANFTKYEGKENSMEFLNPFLADERVSMKNFLTQISSQDSWIPNLISPSSRPTASSFSASDKLDLGRHLSCLHTILFENISQISPTHSTAIRLRQILDEINATLHRPTIPQLEQISQPTLKTLEKLNRQNTNEKSFSSGLQLPWSWTLPKKSRNYSHPAPHHEAPKTHFFVKNCQGSTNPSVSTTAAAATASSSSSTSAVDHGGGISLSSDTSSSASMTPSPGLQIKDSRRTWPGQNQTNPRRATSKMFSSSMSLDDTDSSDDSTYSGNPYHNHHRNLHHETKASPTQTSAQILSQTLPRPLTGTGKRSLSDYESEIMELRSNMESLQLKLSEAERKLRNAKDGKFDDVGNNLADEDDEDDDDDDEYEDSEVEVKNMLRRLLTEEDLLRRQEVDGMMGEKEMMILMQQKKIAALDHANGKLRTELSRLGDKLKCQRPEKGTLSVVHSGDSPVRVFHKSSSAAVLNPTPEAPKTVDELLDSLHSTPI